MINTLYKLLAKVGITSNQDKVLHFLAGLVIAIFASAFFGTDLITRLTSKNIDTLIIMGCTTSGCVRATTVDAIQYGFRPIVIEDAIVQGGRGTNIGNTSAATHRRVV